MKMPRWLKTALPMAADLVAGWWRNRREQPPEIRECCESYINEPHRPRCENLERPAP